jgi:hypothetical protein
MIVIKGPTKILRGHINIGSPNILNSFLLNLYGRFSKDNSPTEEFRYIEYSFDGEDWTQSTLLTKNTSNNPIYDLIFTTTTIQTDVWVRPGVEGTTAIMLGDTISLTGTIEGEYPYSQETPYQYSVFNSANIPSKTTTNLYFEIAQF